MTSHPTIEIGIVHYPGAQLAAIHGLSDLFEVANRFVAQHQSEGSAFLLVSQWHARTRGKAPVRDHDKGESADRSPAVILLPPSLGGQISHDDAAPFVDWLVEHHRAGTTLGSMCGGAFLLAETGLLNGRTATTHWAHADIFRTRFPDVRLDVDRLIIDDGDIICAGGLMAWIDLGLKLVDRFLGPTIMAETARFLLVDPPGREQRYYSAFSPNLIHGDAAVLKTQHWLQATGMTAIDYCQQLRVGKAREMLQFTTSSIETVAWDVGYRDVGAFRKIFSRVTGLTPGEFRRRFTVNHG
ncbi:GlxA family transcriptional regulator [Paraburkholderia sp. SIMBA_054]|uniref:GlxA family transcriptional regulator n=1 Tax=Paraburkholderia sp. SIMBA_054 TaxID=3085795 RepID=UPI00397820F4